MQSRSPLNSGAFLRFARKPAILKNTYEKAVFRERNKGYAFCILLSGSECSGAAGRRSPTFIRGPTAPRDLACSRRCDRGVAGWLGHAGLRERPYIHYYGCIGQVSVSWCATPRGSALVPLH